MFEHLPFLYMNHWLPLQTENDFQNIIQLSVITPQIIFKHSTRCGTSHHAQAKLTTGSSLLSQKAGLHFLDLLQFRALSNLIADELGVMHQSPQVLVLKNKEVVFKTSHHAIEVDKIVKHL